ncbi:Peptide chain release factor 1 [Chlamydiales bacterium SCGC AG-110-P3]|nr:Peptide chain release factor 1 [Chlamydiales bacterium SCGC AG-110-P3]
MDSKIVDKMARMGQRLMDVEAALGEPGVFDDQKRYRELTQEHSYLSEVCTTWKELQGVAQELEDNRQMVSEETDLEFLAVLKDDIAALEHRVPDLEARIEALLVPPDPNDHRTTIIEIRAGTGGDEAALFVGDCLRMYRLFADAQGWTYEVLSGTPAEVGGYKEIVIAFSGKNVFRFLQYEGGTHRVQRVPETESQGRVHTSAVTVAVLPEMEEDADIELDQKDLRVDTYRASGAGGQHVNTTDSAVRVTHVPTGVVSYCSQEKSQHKNKDMAMRLLKAKLAEIERERKESEMASARASQVGSGDRSERIRTYNFPQNRVTDHRINLTMYNLDRLMDGALLELTGALVSHFYQEKLQA